MNMITTETQHQFKLIEGTYSASEVVENVIPMINAEIERINIKSLNALDGYSSHTKVFEDKIKVLKAARERLKKLLREADSDKKQIKVQGNIHVKLLP